MALLENKNFAFSLLIGNITDADTGITVTAGEGSNFPTTGIFMAVIWGSAYASPGLDATREIVEATFVSGDAFTITRSQEGTSAKAWSIGDNIACVLTAGKVNELETITQSGVTSFGIATGVNTMTAVLSPALPAYAMGVTLNLKFTSLSTSTVTLNINGIGAKKVYGKAGSSYTQLGAGHIKANSYGTVVYDTSLDTGNGGWIFLELDLYTYDLSSNAQTQITANTFPVTTSMVFYQAAAPTGWTKKSDWAANASMVVGNTFGSGGSDSPTSWQTALASAGHALTLAENGPHTHGDGTLAIGGGSHTHSYEGRVSRAAGYADFTVGGAASTKTTTGTGAHSHTVSGSTGSSGSGTAHSHTLTQATYTPIYQVMIVGVKN